MRSCAERRAVLGAAALASAALAACAVTSPETDVKASLAALGAVEVEAGGARVALSRVAFSDVAVSMDGPRALVVAIVEADGRVGLSGAEPALTYVGREAFEMSRCARARFCLAPDALGGLRGVVAALAAAPRPDGARVLAWQVRVERDAAEAGEDYEAVEDGARRRLRARRALARDGAGWRVRPPR